jgi:hypothetical protein
MAIPTIVLQLDQPGQPDLLLNISDVEVYQFTYTQASNGAPIDFTGLTGTWDVRDAAGATVIAGSATCGNGYVNVTIPSAVTVTIIPPVGTVPGVPWTVGTFRLRVSDGTDTKTLEENAILGMV